MARSVRVTWRDPDGRAHLADKRRQIKEAVAHERVATPGPEVATTPAMVRIVTRERGPLVHYPASEADLRAVLARLPPDLTARLGTIHLGLYRRGVVEEQEWHLPLEGAPVDPAGFGLTRQNIPGVFSGNVLGLYLPESGDIELYGYVYDPAIPHRPLLELFLRLQMLATFVHELGHHDGASRRAARGRWHWGSGDDASAEVYAEAMQHLWVRDVVIPYLHEAYPDDMRAMSAWIEQHGGVAFPLELFIPDHRETNTTDQSSKWLFPIDDVWVGLYTHVTAGESRDECRRWFAANLSLADHHDEALAVLDRLEHERPSYREARLVRASVYRHLGRLDEAEAIVRALLAADPAEDTASASLLEEAWGELARIAEDQGQWERSLTVARQMKEACAGNVTCQNQALWLEALSLIELGRFDEADEAIRQFADETMAHTRRLRALWWLRQGRHDEVLALVAGDHDLLGGAAAFEASRRLGVLAEAPSDVALSYLETHGFRAWAAELRALL